MDYLDLYLIHAPWPWADMGGDYSAQNIASWRAMEELYRAGKVRAIGVSNFMPEHIKPLLDACEIVPHVNQISFMPDTSSAPAARTANSTASLSNPMRRLPRARSLRSRSSTRWRRKTA